jgi:single-strand DNA-binding protein
VSRSINRVTLLGHLGKDVEIKFTPNGVQRGQFTVATSRRWKDKESGEWKEETDWHQCILWRCENVASYLTKGKQVVVEGRLQTSSYDLNQQKHYVTEVVCDDVILLGGGAAVDKDMGGLGVSDDDVPF